MMVEVIKRNGSKEASIRRYEDDSVSFLCLDGDSMDDQGLNQTIVHMLLDGGFSRVAEDCGFGVDNHVDGLALVDPAHVFGSQLHEATSSVVKFSFNFAFHEGLAVLGLVNPFTVIVADSQTDVDDITVI